MTLSFCLRFGCDYRGPGDVYGSNLVCQNQRIG